MLRRVHRRVQNRIFGGTERQRNSRDRIAGQVCQGTVPDTGEGYMPPRADGLAYLAL